MVTRTITITAVAVTAGPGHDVHYGRQARDSDREQPYTALSAMCGRDKGRRGRVPRDLLVVSGPVTCPQCLA